MRCSGASTARSPGLRFRREGACRNLCHTRTLRRSEGGEGDVSHVHPPAVTGRSMDSTRPDTRATRRQRAGRPSPPSGGARHGPVHTFGGIMSIRDELIGGPRVSAPRYWATCSATSPKRRRRRRSRSPGINPHREHLFSLDSALDEFGSQLGIGTSERGLSPSVAGLLNTVPRRPEPLLSRG
jgi:hypothetical protein